jgi:hypothetical protein
MTKDIYRYCTGKAADQRDPYRSDALQCCGVASLEKLLDIHGLHDVKVSFGEIPFPSIGVAHNINDRSKSGR